MTSKLTASFHWNAWEDYIYWHSNDAKIFSRINQMIKAIQQGNTKFQPVMLKGALDGFCSAKIDTKHRLVYKITDATIIIAQCCLQD